MSQFFTKSAGAVFALAMFVALWGQTLANVAA